MVVNASFLKERRSILSSSLPDLKCSELTEITPADSGRSSLSRLTPMVMLFTSCTLSESAESFALSSL